MPAFLTAIQMLQIPRAYAQVNDIAVDPCAQNVGLTCTSDLIGHVDQIFFDGGSGALFVAFVGIVFGMMVFYGFKLAVESRTDAALTDAFRAYSQAFLGAIVVSGAYILARSFAEPGDILDAAEFEINYLDRIITLCLEIVGYFLVANIVIQGIRMIVAEDDSTTENARKNFIQSLVGAAIVMVTVPVFRAIRPGTFQDSITAEFIGVANFLATIFGFLAVVAFVVAGIFLVLSVNDSLKDRARTLVIASLVAIIVVVSSLALLTILLP